MFTSRCFIRKNTKELRDELSKMGYNICLCAEFEDSVWIETHAQTNVGDAIIHGIGYYDDLSPFDNTNDALIHFIKENNISDNPLIDCGENEELFLALCALNDETDKNQWFFSTGWTDFQGNPIPDKWVFCDQDTLEHFAFVNNSPNSYRSGWKKATVEELIEHFKN